MHWSEEKWQPGMQVRLVHNPLRIGMLTDAKSHAGRDRRLFQIRFPDIVERVYEDQLQPLPEEQMNLLDLLAERKLGTPKDLRRTLTHVRLTGATGGHHLQQHASHQHGSQCLSIQACIEASSDTHKRPSDRRMTTRPGLVRSAAMSPFDRVDTPDESAEVVAFLASDRAPWVDGWIVQPNGGVV